MMFALNDLTTILENADIGLARVTAEGRFVYVNGALAEMTGLTSEHLTGQPWQRAFHPEDHDTLRSGWPVAHGESVHHPEVRIPRRDGGVVHADLTITCLTDRDGESRGYCFFLHDISDHKKAQECLELAVESAPSGLLMLDQDGTILMVNQAVEELFDYSRAELIGRDIECLLPERYRSGHAGFHRQFGAEGLPRAMAGRDLPGLRRDGTEILLQIFLNLITTPQGLMILVTLIDIGERAQYQRQLEAARVAAEEANQAKSDFLACMSHEIRTPMNLIMGMTATLLETGLTEQQRRYVEVSHRNVKRLLRLINGILDLSKIEAGKLTLEPAPFDLRDLLDEAVETFSPAVDQKPLHLGLFVEQRLHRLWIGDKGRLQQVIHNLIGNAVKFTERGSILVKALPARRYDGTEGIRIDVSDTGCGIAPEIRARIFERFQQGDGSFSRRYEGTGLGLSIARSLVNMMGGEIWVEEQTGPGTMISFTVFIPRFEGALKKEERAPHRSSGASQIGQGTRLLVVDDNPENTFLIEAFLEKQSLLLDFASDGAEAVEKRKTSDYDMILMDVQMPVMDGYTATRAIRAWEASESVKAVPIVALTAHALAGASEEAREAGCDGYLSKPVEREDLIAAIARHGACASTPVAYESTIEKRRPAFLNNRRTDILKLHEAIAAGDLTCVQRIGHDCRGIGKADGFPAISEAGAELQRAALTGDAVAVRRALLEFRIAVEEASSAEGEMAAA